MVTMINDTKIPPKKTMAKTKIKKQWTMNKETNTHRQ